MSRSAETFAQADLAYVQLRELVVGGSYRPGDRLAEVPLATLLSMSRTPIREALRRLEGDGLVRSTGRGVIVASLDEHHLAETYEVREALESLTAELAARRQREGRVPPADLTALHRIAKDAEVATARRAIDLAVTHNRSFHRQVAVMAANAMALTLLDRLWDQVVVSTAASLAPLRRSHEVAREHRTIIAAIERGDARRAAQAARRHVRRTAATSGVRRAPETPSR